jgi:hypothetical protein
MQRHGGVFLEFLLNINGANNADWVYDSLPNPRIHATGKNFTVVVRVKGSGKLRIGVLKSCVCGKAWDPKMVPTAWDQIGLGEFRFVA